MSELLIPDFTVHRMVYTAKADVEAGGRTFALRMVVKADQDCWPFYHFEDVSDLSRIGDKQRRVVSPVRTALMRAVFAALREAGWHGQPMDGIYEPPITHTALALQTIQNGGWSR